MRDARCDWIMDASPGSVKIRPRSTRVTRVDKRTCACNHAGIAQQYDEGRHLSSNMVQSHLHITWSNHLNPSGFNRLARNVAQFAVEHRQQRVLCVYELDRRDAGERRVLARDDVRDEIGEFARVFDARRTAADHHKGEEPRALHRRGPGRERSLEEVAHLVRTYASAQ